MHLTQSLLRVFIQLLIDLFRLSANTIYVGINQSGIGSEGRIPILYGQALGETAKGSEQ